MMIARNLRRASVVAMTLASAVACGSASTKTASSADDDVESSSEPESADSPDDDVDHPQETRQPRCDDGSCIECGDAICPTGYYCDEGLKPPVCAWIPACATDSTCGCLGRALADCSCETRGAGAYVKCR